MAENRFKKYAEPEAGVFYRDPLIAAEEARKQQDQEYQRRQVEIAQQNANTSAANAAVTAANATRPKEGYRSRLDGSWEFIPGGPADPAKVAANAAATEEAKRSGKRMAGDPDRMNQIMTVLENIRQMRELAGKNLSVGKFADGVGDIPLIGRFLGQNRADLEGALQMVEGDLIQQQVAKLAEQNQGGVTGMVNSPLEAQRMAAAIANLNPNQSEEQFLLGLQRAEDYYLRQLDTMKSTSGVPEPKAAGAGATEKSLPIPAEMQAAHAAYLRQNWGKLTPDGYAAFRADLDKEYGFTPDPEAYRSAVEGLNASAAEGQSSDGRNVPPPTVAMTESERATNDFLNTGAGRFATAALNSALVGAPGALADAKGYGDNLDMMRDESSGEMFAGDLLGGAIGTGLVGGGLRILTRSPINPVWSDAAYSTAFGAAEGDDPVTGALMGLGGSLGGSVAGRYAGRALPRLTGAGPQPQLLTTGERAAYENAGDMDDVALSLFEAEQLGVPMSLADASPGLNSVAGSAVRHSPAVAGDARDMVARRNEGQGDRLLQAVERDLGPVANIPATSEALVQQARARAGPLYDAAYAAPGATALDLTDLYERPSMRAALGRAFRIAEEEGRDPLALGFARDLDARSGEPLVSIQRPSWQTLDYLKRGLDDTLEAYRDPVTGRLNLDTEGRAIEGTRQAFLQRVDTMNPDYAAARAAYAGPMQERAFMERGQDAVTSDPQQLGVDFARLTPEQQAQMRLGYQSRLTTRGGDLRNNSNPWGQLNTPNTEQRLDVLYAGAEDADIANLLAQRDLELQVAGSGNRLVGNSATAERLAADEAFKAGNGADTASVMAEAAISGGVPWVSGARALGTRFLRGRQAAAESIRNRAQADEIGELLLNDSPAQSMVNLGDLADRVEEERALLEAVLGVAGHRGERIGSALGRASAVSASR